MPIAYVAQTRDHLFMLDDEGVCVHVHPRLHAPDPHRANGASARDGRGGHGESDVWQDGAREAAVRCIGAQYVASLDPNEPGFLGHSPTLGVPMVFAKADAHGKISLVRTGPIERFEVRGSGLYERSTPTSDFLVDTGRTISPAIVYLSEEDLVQDDDEPTVFYRGPRPQKASTAYAVSNPRGGRTYRPVSR